jgi:hypothetical protein
MLENFWRKYLTPRNHPLLYTILVVIVVNANTGYQLNPRQNLTGLQDLSGLIFQSVAG